MAQVLSASTLHPWSSTWRTLHDSTSPFLFYFFLLSVSVFLFHLELFPELLYTKVMANLRLSTAKESEDTLNAFTSPTKTGGKLTVGHTAIGWMIEHCADILNKCQVGKDGRSPYEPFKGKKYGGTLMEFGSPVMLRVPDKPQGGLMQERWIERVWLVSRFNTLEHFVSRRSDGVVVRTRAVRVVPRTVQKSDLDSIVGQHHAPQGVQRFEKNEVPPACVAPPTERAVPTSGPDPLRLVLRAVYITNAMLEKHDYTTNCGKSRAIQRGQSQTTIGHTTVCRKCMEELLGNDMEYQHR